MKMAWLTRLRKYLGSEKSQIVLINNQKGQAVIEYTLLLVISTIIILGVLYQFNDAFRKFTKSYFGNYLGCLIETGELPGSQGICSGDYQSFSIANGEVLVRPTNPGGGIGGVDSGSGNSGNGAGGSNKGGDSSDLYQNPKGSGQSENGSSRSIPISSSNGERGFSNRSSGSDGGEKTNAKGKGQDVALGANDPVGPAGYGSFNPSATSTSTSAFDQSIGRLRFIPANKDEKKAKAKKEKIELTDADKKKGTRRVAAVGKNSSKGDGAEIDGNISVPNFIRYLLMAAIGIAIFLFIGGQAVAFRKGQEKN